MAKMHIACVATLLLLALGANGARMLQEPVPVDPQPTDQQVGHGGFRYDYFLYINNASSTYAPVITSTEMEAIWGCGASNQKCSCNSVHDPSWMNPIAVSMQGQGTDGTATGLEFLCRFTVSFVDEQTGASLPGCRCSLHINMPYMGSNKWNHDCPCLDGFSAQIPENAYVVSTSDIVQRKM